MGCSPFVRLVWSGFFLVVLYFLWGTSSRFHPILLLLLTLSGASFLAVVAELVAPSWAPPGVRPPAQRMLFDAPTVEEEPPAPTPGERAAHQERDSRSGFVVLILALLVMLGLVAYFALHGP